MTVRDEREECGAEFYDNLVVASPSYNGPSTEIVYYPMWLEMLKNIDKDEAILDLGCGPGQFAEVAIYTGHEYLGGIDFSSEMIRIAKERLPDHANKFNVGNLYDSSIYDVDYDVIVMSEVLEHIKDDRVVLGLIDGGTHIVASLPSFDYISHVRYFQNVDDILDRYWDYIDMDIQPFTEKSGKLYFIINGYRK